MKYSFLLTCFLAVAAYPFSMEIISETSYPVDIGARHIEIIECELLESGGISTVIRIGNYFQNRLVRIAIGADGETIDVTENIQPDLHTLSYGALPTSTYVHLIHRNREGDTLWTCQITGTNIDYYNTPNIIELSDGGYMIDCPPDCFSEDTCIQRISSNGEDMWHYWLHTDFLVDSTTTYTSFIELPPRIARLRELRDGKILIVGKVARELTSSDAYFATCLASNTGELLWSGSGFGHGEAAIKDAIEIESGLIIAVGATSETSHPEGQNSVSIWGRSKPMLLVMDQSGSVLELEVPLPGLTRSYRAIAPICNSAIGDEFMIVGLNFDTYDLTLIRIALTLP